MWQVGLQKGGGGGGGGGGGEGAPAHGSIWVATPANSKLRPFLMGPETVKVTCAQRLLGVRDRVRVRLGTGLRLRLRFGYGYG